MSEGLRKFRVRFTEIRQACIEATGSELAVAKAMDEYDIEFGQVVDVTEVE